MSGLGERLTTWSFFVQAISAAASTFLAVVALMRFRAPEVPFGLKLGRRRNAPTCWASG